MSELTVNESGFPFEEVARFDSLQQVPEGVSKDHIWSVVVTDLDCGCTSWCYGPSHHYVNLMHYVQTAERHDGDTYYEDTSHLENCLEEYLGRSLKDRYFDLEMDVAVMTEELEETDEILSLQSKVAMLLHNLTDADIEWLKDASRSYA